MLALGIDFGTSGARAILLQRGQANAIDHADSIVAEATHRFPDVGAASSVDGWVDALWRLLGAITPAIRAQINRIAINGTSATMLLCDRRGDVLTKPLLYNDASGRSALSDVRVIAPGDCSAVLSATSTLTKAMWLYRQGAHSVQSTEGVRLVHQADFLAYMLHRQRAVTDYHNALKLGYDVRTLSYPDWLMRSPIAPWLPSVVEPGAAIAPIDLAIAEKTGLPKDCQIHAGTTDSIAAFLASGAHQPGEAVTSLGSTLVLKLLSHTPIDAPLFGIYSHRLGDLWLVGGASNTGGAVLQKFFTHEQLTQLSDEIGAQVDLKHPSPLNYYPLNSPGERFPVNDPDYPPRLLPRPASDRDFLYGLLDAIARIETDGYHKLVELGAPELTQVFTAGGGAQNLTWQKIRQQRLGVTVTAAAQVEAAYGTAQLAMKGLGQFKA